MWGGDLGLGCNFEVEPLPSMCEALVSIPSTAKNKPNQTKTQSQNCAHSLKVQFSITLQIGTHF
jgi:hypothetical protein